MKATVKQVFNYIQGLNPSTSTISSLGSFVTEQSQQVSDMIHREVTTGLPEGTLAHKILTTSEKYSEKQLWVIAYELMKNDCFTEMVGKFYSKIEAKENAKREASKNKFASNKENSQHVLDHVKSSGRLLGDYYNWLKKSKQYKREFFSKKFTMESAEEFLNS